MKKSHDTVTFPLHRPPFLVKPHVPGSRRHAGESQSSNLDTFFSPVVTRQHGWMLIDTPQRETPSPLRCSSGNLASSRFAITGGERICNESHSGVSLYNYELLTFIHISMFLPLVDIFERSFTFPCFYLWWISMNVHSFFHVLICGGCLWTLIHISMFLPVVDIYKRSFIFPCSYLWWISLNVHSHFHVFTFGGYLWTFIHFSMFLSVVDVYER